MSYEIVDAAIYLMPALLIVAFAAAYVATHLPHAH
jgi:hypothetical protein